jgi:hypothetical protein
MKFYVIPPNSHLDLMDNGDRYFALAHHFILDKDYKETFLRLRKERPDAFITLDNSAAEESLVTEDVLLSIVEELKPNEVIAPDVLFDKQQTLANLKTFCEKMKAKGFLKHTNIFACPQGNTTQEWLECYFEMASNPLVSVIGLSKIAVPKCWLNLTGDLAIGISRNMCVQELKNRGWLGMEPIHLLGMGEHNEFDFYLENNTGSIRSSDSCYTVLAAINDISFEDGDTTRVPTTNAYFHATMTEEQKDLAKRNVMYLKRKYAEI